jgi:hypothetical protein
VARVDLDLLLGKRKREASTMSPLLIRSHVRVLLDASAGLSPFSSSQFVELARTAILSLAETAPAQASI